MYDELLAYPGKSTPDGPSVAGLTVASLRDKAPINIDIIGVGASPYDYLNGMGLQVLGVNVAIPSNATDKGGVLTFFNLRSELWWKLREALDPANNTGIELPNDARLRADLCAPLWKPAGREIRVESRDEIIKRIGRSPDYASAVILAQMDMPKLSMLAGVQSSALDSYDPLEKI